MSGEIYTLIREPLSLLILLGSKTGELEGSKLSKNTDLAATSLFLLREQAGPRILLMRKQGTCSRSRIEEICCGVAGIESNRWTDNRVSELILESLS